MLHHDPGNTFFRLRHASTIPHQSLYIYVSFPLLFFFLFLSIFLINIIVRWIFQILKISIQILFQKGLFNRRNIKYHFFSFFFKLFSPNHTKFFRCIWSKKKKKEKILQHGRFIFVSEPWNMKWYKPHFCYIYVLFQHYILYRFISFHFKFNLTGFSNSTGLPLFDTPIIHSKFQIYNFILEELKFIITKIKNWIIYI